MARTSASGIFDVPAPMALASGHRDYSLGGLRIVAFPTVFRLLTVPDLPEGIGRKFAPDAKTLAAFPPDGHQIAEFIAGERPDLNHVPGAIAFLRYYERADVWIVIELQCDLFAQLRPARLRGLLRDWPIILLAGLCRFAMEAERVTQIGLVGPEYIRRRFPTINLRLLRRIYSDLPETLGFTKQSLSLALEPHLRAINIRTISIIPTVALQSRLVDIVEDIGR